MMVENADRDLLRRIAGHFGAASVEAFVVGGTVRDWLLGRSSQDLDLAVAGDALHLTRTLADELDAAFVVLDTERDTARVVLRRPGGSTRYVDVARLRGASLAADLAARDFTVNALAVRLEDAAAGRLDPVDVAGGLLDLGAGRLRATSESAFRDDPLRLLRAVRLAAELGFAIEPETRAWMARYAPAIREPAAERVRDELVRLLACPGTASYLRLMDALDLLAPLLPELVAGQGVTQPPSHHQWDVFEHALVAVDRMDGVFGALGLAALDGQSRDVSLLEGAYRDVAGRLAPFAAGLRSHLESQLVGGRPRWALLKLIALLHDVGKPETRSVDKAGEIHFYGHERASAGIVADLLRRFHFGSHEVKIGRTVTLHHMRPKWLAGSEKVTPRAIYRFFRDTSDSGLDVILLSLADALAGRDEPPEAGSWQAHLETGRRLLSAWFETPARSVAPPPLIRGAELIEALGLEAGPIVGQVIEAIREAQVSERVSTREEALSFAREWLAGEGVAG